MNGNGSSKDKRISIATARELAKQHGVLILWRPETELPESEQYAILKTRTMKGVAA